MTTLNYEVSDAQLVGFGIAQRIIDLSRQPFMRTGGVDFDIPYAMAIWDASDTVSLAALAINNPGKAVRFPPCGRAYMGFVPGVMEAR